LLLAWLAGERLHWLAILVLLLGALLPDLDNQDSLLGRALPFLSRPLQDKFGHHEAWHTPAVVAGLTLLGLPLLAFGGWQAWVALPLGFGTHLLVDLLSPPGVMLFWPLSLHHHRLLSAPLAQQGGRAEGSLAALLGLAVALLILVVGVGAEPPPPIVAPSYEQTVERYYSLRGRTLVYASIQGTWQASGRRIGGTFEILNAVGASFILLDLYTGDVFSAGRTAGDNLYLNGISLQTGDEARVKPAEIHLEDEPVANALPVLYEMQAEPGLQHIYVSGDLLLSPNSAGPRPDYSQTSLRLIQQIEPEHYRLSYLTAADLINLAGLQVEMADLLIVGTYAVPGSGPTVTPLPPAGGQAEP
jgi:inner membrane protein